MKKAISLFFVITSFILLGCAQKQTKSIVFATAADYPPFEFNQSNILQGFDIDLAILIAKKMNKQAIFENMQFSTILAALQSNSVDAAISTITITAARQKNFDFSDSYYDESMFIVYKSKSPLKNKESLKHKKIACQLGSTMEFWLKNNIPNKNIVIMNNNNQAIEALKADLIDGVLIDNFQAKTFVNKNPDLLYSFITKSNNGYAIAIKKGSALKEPINKAIKQLKQDGELDKLKKKWLGDES